MTFTFVRASAITRSKLLFCFRKRDDIWRDKQTGWKPGYEAHESLFRWVDLIVAKQREEVRPWIFFHCYTNDHYYAKKIPGGSLVLILGSASKCENISVRLYLPSFTYFLLRIWALKRRWILKFQLSWIHLLLFHRRGVRVIIHVGCSRIWHWLTVLSKPNKERCHNEHSWTPQWRMLRG